MANHNGNLSPRTIFGLGLIVVAVLLFFNNIGLKFVGVILSNWPIALIVIGAVLLYKAKQSKGQQNFTVPYFLIALGVVFLLARHNIVGLSFGTLIVPLVLLFVGIHLLRPHRFCGKDKPWKMFFSMNNTEEEKKSTMDTDNMNDKSLIALNDEQANGDAARDNVNAGGKIDVFAILGGGDFVTHSQNLTGGTVVAVLGGGDIDIRSADTQENTIEIDVLAFMGGVEIKVPPHWEVTSRVLPFLGGVSNKTTCLADKMNVPKKHLVVTGLAFMGGIDIRN